ncbi:MAG: hypothetical protein HY560_09725 [Gemmatimonadetes bacterium]|nr:hypothetical protein [Gemmatimonadota bacterium]
MNPTLRATQMALAALTAVASATVRPGCAGAQDSLPSVFERTGLLRSPRLFESSGVAVSRHQRGVLWTHNDSGDPAMIYAINLAGDLLAMYRVPGATNEDWEDIALGPCPAARGSCLYIGDTGDNEERRKSVVIYVVPEPTLPASPPTSDTLTAPAKALRLRYPDGPHDVEALAVDPAGNATLVTKGRTPAVLRFTVPKAAFALDSTTALLADTLPIAPLRTLGRLVTSAAISPSGRRAVVRTYSELYFFRRSPGGALTRDGAPCWIGAAEPVGEAVDFLDEETVVLTSESLPDQVGPVHRVRCARPQPGARGR